MSFSKNKKEEEEEEEEKLRVTSLYDALYMCGREWLNIVMRIE